MVEYIYIISYIFTCGLFSNFDILQSEEMARKLEKLRYLLFLTARGSPTMKQAYHHEEVREVFCKDN